MGTMRVHITFVNVLQDIQDYKVTDPGEDQMVSKIFFWLELDGSRQMPLSVVEVRQPVGTDYKTAPLTVGPLSQDVTDGPWNQEAFTEAVVDYYRSALGKGISFGKASNLRMRNNTINHVKSYEFDIETGWSPPP